MKFKTTQKAVRAGFDKIICVSYCGLQNLLNYEIPVAYTVRREGWGADIYDIGGGVAIVTGYAPFGNIKPKYEIVRAYDEKAEKARYMSNYADKKQLCKELQRDFIREVVGNE